MLCGSELPGNKVSTTIAGMPSLMCSSAACPPSAAAAVRACWKSTAPTKPSRDNSFSYVLTHGRLFSADSEIAWRTSCSVTGADFGEEEQARVKRRVRELFKATGKRDCLGLTETSGGWRKREWTDAISELQLRIGF